MQTLADSRLYICPPLRRCEFSSATSAEASLSTASECEDDVDHLLRRAQLVAAGVHVRSSNHLTHHQPTRLILRGRVTRCTRQRYRAPQTPRCPRAEARSRPRLVPLRSTSFTHGDHRAWLEQRCSLLQTGHGTTHRSCSSTMVSRVKVLPWVKVWGATLARGECALIKLRRFQRF